MQFNLNQDTLKNCIDRGYSKIKLYYEFQHSYGLGQDSVFGISNTKGWYYTDSAIEKPGKGKIQKSITVSIDDFSHGQSVWFYMHNRNPIGFSYFEVQNLYVEVTYLY